MRKTALKKAPRISARTHYSSQLELMAKTILLTPKVYWSLVAFCAADTAHKPIASEMMSLSCRVSKQSIVEYRKAYHVKGIGRQSKGVCEETGDQFEQEECRIDGDHHLDPGALGPSHFLKDAHDGGCPSGRAIRYIV